MKNFVKQRDDLIDHAGWYVELVTFIITILGFLSSVFSDFLKNHTKWVIGTVVLLVIINAFFMVLKLKRIKKSVEDQKNIEALKNEIKGLENNLQDRDKKIKKMQEVIIDYEQCLKEYYHKYLGEISRDDLKLTENERISLFKIVKDEESCIMLGRYSENHFYKGIGRPLYPSKQGCIGKALRKNKYYITDLPDYEEQEFQYIAKQQEIFRLSPETIKNLTMKARAYSAYAIKNKDNHDKVAVIVIESDLPREEEFLKEKIKILESKYNNKIAYLIENVNWKPKNDLSNAAKGDSKMANIVDIVAYFCKNYPYKNELSKARLTKLVYLADWHSAIVNRHQISDIQWKFNHYGPYVEDVVRIAERHYAFDIVQTHNCYGSGKTVIRIMDENYSTNLTRGEIQILEYVIEKTEQLNFNDFIELVYSTYPVVSSRRGDFFDLVKLAEEYEKQIKPLL